MLQFVRGKILPLTTQFLKPTFPVCGRCLSSPVEVRLHHRPPASRPVPSLTLLTFNLSGRLGLHTSSQQQRRKEQVTESLLVTTTQHHWQEIKKTPIPALFLGLAGAALFVAPPLTMCITNTYIPGLASAQVLYGACILSFLGGVRWGYILQDHNPIRSSWVNLVTGAMIPYWAFISLLLMDSIGSAVIGLGVGFSICVVMDILGSKQMGLAPLGPLWYKWLRGLLTLIVLASLMATPICKSRYPQIETMD